MIFKSGNYTYVIVEYVNLDLFYWIYAVTHMLNPHSQKGSYLPSDFLTILNNCRECKISKYTTQKVPPRGVPESQVLFIGEAPGKREDATGKPFIGPSYDVLLGMIQEVKIRIGKTFSFAFTNTIMCTPYVDKTKTSIRTPTETEVSRCRQHVYEVVRLFNPQLIVCIGKTASDFYIGRFDVPMLRIFHPEYISRNGGIGSDKYEYTLIKLTRKINETLYGMETKEKRKSIQIQ